MDYDHYIFCQMVRELMIDTEEKGCSQTPVRTMLLLDRRVADELSEQTENRKCVPAKLALYSVVRLENADAKQLDLSAMFCYAKEHDLRLQNRLFMVEVPLISYTDLDHYYAELFIPLAE